MQFTTTLATLLAFAASTLAAPTPAESTTTLGAPISARDVSWTLQNFGRLCDSGSCTYAYDINDGQSVTSCYYKSAGPQASYSQTCGPYAITSAWSGQFGPNNGFSTMSIVKDQQIIYPSYSDAELQANPVKPDHAYAPVPVPA